MPLPLWDPLRDIADTAVRGAGIRATVAIATAFLVLVATVFLVSAGFVVLMREVGVPVAALTFAALFAMLALATHLFGRAICARQTARSIAARNRAGTDIALAAMFSRSARPLLPLAAFLAAFVLARRS
ncbi:MAG: hypothetical protein COW54_00750 [Rhodobacteraceae bacterium CG17_big_fil_post_rev_8_21_14_2_50_63_15]|nr:hypothetical protein [Roseovarius sp.]PIV80079.1 MAG: hypothetical protein COW54_00750 [Rhodobacteraceae bacterium CG17_big_fil_post_rev_8_21_14_2_50_63_15]